MDTGELVKRIQPKLDQARSAYRSMTSPAYPVSPAAMSVRRASSLGPTVASVPQHNLDNQRRERIKRLNSMPRLPSAYNNDITTDAEVNALRIKRAKRDGTPVPLLNTSPRKMGLKQVLSGLIEGGKLARGAVADAVQDVWDPQTQVQRVVALPDGTSRSVAGNAVNAEAADVTTPANGHIDSPLVEADSIDNVGGDAVMPGVLRGTTGLGRGEARYFDHRTRSNMVVGTNSREFNAPEVGSATPGGGVVVGRVGDRDEAGNVIERRSGIVGRMPEKGRRSANQVAMRGDFDGPRFNLRPTRDERIARAVGENQVASINAKGGFDRDIAREGRLQASDDLRSQREFLSAENKANRESRESIARNSKTGELIFDDEGNPIGSRGDVRLAKQPGSTTSAGDAVEYKASLQSFDDDHVILQDQLKAAKENNGWFDGGEGEKSIADIEGQIKQNRTEKAALRASRVGGGAAKPKANNQPEAKAAKPLTPEIVAQFIKQNGGDRVKARDAAKAAGYSATLS